MRSKVSVPEGIKGGALALPVLVGLSASAALLVDYARQRPVFCAEGGGCDAVKHTPLAMPLGLPMPAFGLAGFCLLLVLALLRGHTPRALHCVASLFGASIGAGLIAAQIAIGQYCAYCLATDLAALTAAAIAVWRYRGEWDLDVRPTFRLGLASLLVALPAAVLTLGFTAKVHLPPLIAQEMQRAPKGKATVVEFVDFECPFCRDEYSALSPMLLATKEKLHVVRKLVPLTRIHPHALDAAKAACCGEVLGKGDAMADALFSSPIEELTPTGCEKIAIDLGLDPAQYDACVSDPKTADRLASDREQFDHAAAKGDGLPLLWIGDRKMMGAQNPEELRRALDEAIAKAGS
jgi:protein-disulfide isomerase